MKADDGIFWMDWSTFVNYYQYTSTALYRDYKHKVATLDTKKREYTYTIDNPTSQYFYISVDTFSRRNYPRTNKCAPKTNVYIEFKDENGKAITDPGDKSYSFVNGQTGWALRGLTHKKLPKGKYKMSIINQGGSAHLGINFYASSAMPSIPIKSNGEPKPPVYKAPDEVKVKGMGAGCDGKYTQPKRAAFGNWNNVNGKRTIFYCPRFHRWACIDTPRCTSKSDCGNLAGSCLSYKMSQGSDSGDLTKAKWKGVKFRAA